MSTASKAIIGAVIIIVLAVSGFLAFHKKSTPAATSDSSTSSNKTTTSSSSTSAIPAATITFRSSGFSPALTTVKAGDTVKVSNTSSNDMDFDSDPHPTHTDEPELNIGDVNPGESKTFVVTKVGNWGFHDHLDPSLRGRLAVQ